MTAALLSACYSGEDLAFNRGTYILGDKLEMVREGQIINSMSTARRVVLSMDARRADCNMQAMCFIRPVHYGLVTGLTFRQYQPETRDRGQLYHYPPVIAQPTGGYYIRMEHLLFERVWTAIDGTGNCAFDLDDVRICAFNRGLILDGSYDFCHIKSINAYLYGITTSDLSEIYYDGQAITGAAKP